MIIVTGGLGFIGSNIIHSSNARGITDSILVDDFTDGTKFANVSDAQVADYFDKDEFPAGMKQGQRFNGKVDANTSPSLGTFAGSLSDYRNQ